MALDQARKRELEQRAARGDPEAIAMLETMQTDISQPVAPAPPPPPAPAPPVQPPPPPPPAQQQQQPNMQGLPPGAAEAYQQSFKANTPTPPSPQEIAAQQKVIDAQAVTQGTETWEDKDRWRGRGLLGAVMGAGMNLATGAKDKKSARIDAARTRLTKAAEANRSSTARVGLDKARLAASNQLFDFMSQNREFDHDVTMEATKDIIADENELETASDSLTYWNRDGTPVHVRPMGRGKGYTDIDSGETVNVQGLFPDYESYSKAVPKLNAQIGTTHELAELATIYMGLNDQGAMVDLSKSTPENLWSSVRNIAAPLEQMMGTNASGARARVDSIKPAVATMIRKAEDLGVKGMDTKQELLFYLNMMGDTGVSIQSNMAAVMALMKKYGNAEELQKEYPGLMEGMEVYKDEMLDLDRQYRESLTTRREQEAQVKAEITNSKAADKETFTKAYDAFYEEMHSGFADEDALDEAIQRRMKKEGVW